MAHPAEDTRTQASYPHKADEEYYITVAYLLEIASRGKELFEAALPNEKRELIGLLGQNLFLDGKAVQITLFKPFDTLASCADNSIWPPNTPKVITLIEDFAYWSEISQRLISLKPN